MFLARKASRLAPAAGILRGDGVRAGLRVPRAFPTGVRCITSNPLPASYLRGGTSKGIFLHRHDLPADLSEWDPILLGLMGSPDPEHGRQLNGMGGGVSSLSKVCVVGPPTDAERARGADVVYTFVQVGIRDAVLDFSGNCGNLSSMIGVFAVDQGIFAPTPGTGAHKGVATVRCLNTNTDKIIHTTFPVAAQDGKLVPLLDLPQAAVAGVPGKASQILLEFVDPAGARTGKLLPTGSPSEYATDTSTIFADLEEALGGAPPHPVLISLVDATNPTVFVSEADLRLALGQSKDDSYPIAYLDFTVCQLMEDLRRLGARRMGLDPDAQAQPKVAALDAPTDEDIAAGVDIVIHAFSMGVLHRAVPMTVGLCLGVASGVPGTVAHDIVQASRAKRGAHAQASDLVKIRHPSGIVEVGATFDAKGGVTSAKVVRTGRRLMKGVVWW